jgi:hypothetical protein
LEIAIPSICANNKPPLPRASEPALEGAGFLKQGRDSKLFEGGLLLVLALLFGLSLLNAQGTGDRSQWLSYIASIHQVGVVETYVRAVLDGVGYTKTDYPGLSFAIFGLVALVADITRLSDFDSLKLSLLTFLLATAGLMTVWQGKWRPLPGVAAYLLLVIGALVLVYLDVYFVFFFLLSFYCLQRGRIAWGTTLFVVSFFVKWQPIILAPLILLYALPRNFDIRHVLRLVPAGLLLIAIYLLFGNALIVAFGRGAADSTFSGKALNFDWLLTTLMEAPHLSANGWQVKSVGFDEAPELSQGIFVYLSAASTILRYVCYATAVAWFFLSERAFTDLLRASVVCFMSYFIFGHAVHENHSCLPAVLALCWFALDQSRRLEAVVLGVVFNINILLFYGFSGVGPGFSRVVGWDQSISLAIFNVAFFFILWVPVARPVAARLASFVTGRAQASSPVHIQQ